jgi:hypothetical protein
MNLVIMNKLELVKTLREIATNEDCHLTLRAASKIASWLKDGTAYNITSWIKKDDALDRTLNKNGYFDCV